MSEIPVYECIRNKGFQCSGVNYDIIGENTMRITTDGITGIVFIHEPGECVICTGLEFQVHVWGSRKYTLWLLGAGVNYCTMLTDCFLDQCGGNVYVVSRRPHGCRSLKLSTCEERLSELLMEVGKSLFIGVDVDRNLLREVVNIVRHGDYEDCNMKLNELLKQLTPRG